MHRIELVGGARHLRAVGDDRSGNDRAEHLGAGGELQRLEAAAEGVHQAVTRGFVGFLRGDLVLGDVVDDVDEDLVGIGADVGDMRGHVLCFRWSIGMRRIRCSGCSCSISGR
jgi:hypothetical protein